jgi:O-antigen ligase
MYENTKGANLSPDVELLILVSIATVGLILVGLCLCFCVKKCCGKGKSTSGESAPLTAAGKN